MKWVKIIFSKYLSARAFLQAAVEFKMAPFFFSPELKIFLECLE
jgi:hypothetical protein